MQHLRQAKGRRLTDDEAIALKLREIGFLRKLEDWQRVLYRAADILEHLGWCRGDLERGNRHCAVGAIIAASNEGDVLSERFAASVLLRKRAVQGAINKVQNYLGRSLMEWNDGAARNGKEVASVMRSCATGGG
jgi:hypothetical protein